MLVLIAFSETVFFGPARLEFLAASAEKNRASRSGARRTRWSSRLANSPPLGRPWRTAWPRGIPTPDSGRRIGDGVDGAVHAIAVMPDGSLVSEIEEA